MTKLAHPLLAASNRPGGSVIRAEEASRWLDGQAYLECARDRSAQIIAEAEEARESERRRGFEEGRRAGVEEAIRLIAATKVEADRFVVRLEAELAGLVVEIMGEILEPFDPLDLSARAVVKALQKLRGRSQLTLLTAPADVAELHARLLDILGKDHERMPTSIEADPRLDRGRCLLVSEFGQVEVTVDTQLQLIAQALRTIGDAVSNDVASGERNIV
jgi:type III secretion protein L